MTPCKFPTLAPTTGYSYGCRCSRCRAGAVEVQRQYKRKYPERVKAYWRKNKLERQRRYKRKHPLKHRARWMVYNHLRLGNIVKQPCEVCGRKKVQAHHDDYAKPLKVRWLCKKHHDKEHH